MTAAQVSLAESVYVEKDDLILRFGIDRAAAKEALEELAAKKLLTEVAREAFGKPLRVVLQDGPARRRRPRQGRPRSAPVARLRASAPAPGPSRTPWCVPRWSSFTAS